MLPVAQHSYLKCFRRVRTLYACLGENDGELSFEPNQIITNGNNFHRKIQQISIKQFFLDSEKLPGARLAGGHSERQIRSDTGELCRNASLTKWLSIENLHITEAWSFQSVTLEQFTTGRYSGYKQFGCSHANAPPKSGQYANANETGQFRTQKFHVNGQKSFK